MLRFSIILLVLNSFFRSVSNFLNTLLDTLGAYLCVWFLLGAHIPLSRSSISVPYYHFKFKFYASDISKVTLAFLSELFPWIIVLKPLTLKLCLFWLFKYVYWRQKNIDFNILNDFASPWLLTCAFSSLILREIVVMRFGVISKCVCLLDLPGLKVKLSILL